VSRPQRTIPVHVLADERVHLALAHLGRLKQGRLKTLCAKMAVSELSPFALAEPSRQRCRTCFAKVDEQGHPQSEPAGGSTPGSTATAPAPPAKCERYNTPGVTSYSAEAIANRREIATLVRAVKALAGTTEGGD